LYSPVETQFLPEIPFDANPDQTTDWDLAVSDEFALYSERV
jgi:hypothetical protein